MLTLSSMENLIVECNLKGYTFVVVAVAANIVVGSLLKQQE